MSTQQAPAIDLSIARDLTNFQLIELPDELVTIITTHKDHETPILQLKSEAQTGNAVLCTQNTTFPLRSVQTSNSLFVVQPAESAVQDENSIASHGLRAIASCSITLELSKSKETALPHLRKALPVYTSRDLNASAAAKNTFEEISKDIPLSDGEILQGWTSLCAFEVKGASFRPNAHVLLELWKTMSTTSTADGLDLTSAFLVEDLWISLRDQDFPRELFDAVMRRVEEQSSMEVDFDSNWCTLDKARCSTWLAALIIETRTVGDQTMVVSDFMALWKESVPERWREDLSLDLIKDYTTKSTSTTIALKPEHRLAGPPSSTSNVSQTKAPTKAGKWHEKFKKTRT